MFKRRSKLKTTPDLQVINGGKEVPPTPPHTEQPLLEAQRVEGEENLHEMAKETFKKLGISQAQMARELGNRFRFKIQPEEPAGLLTLLGCQIH